MAETVEKLTTGEPLTIDQLLEYLPALKEIPRAQLENWAKGAAVLHRYRKGEIVCEEGEFGSTAYYIVSGTVQAREPCIMVEMLRVILDMLVGNRQPSELTKATSKVKMPTFKGTSFKTELEKKYRERSLNNHLRAVPLFASLDDEFIEHLRQHVELVSYNQSQVICKEGDDADAFYLIRSGMVRVSNALPGGEMVRIGRAHV